MCNLMGKNPVIDVPECPLLSLKCTWTTLNSNLIQLAELAWWSDTLFELSAVNPAHKKQARYTALSLLLYSNEVEKVSL